MSKATRRFGGSSTERKSLIGDSACSARQDSDFDASWMNDGRVARAWDGRRRSGRRRSLVLQLFFGAVAISLLVAAIYGVVHLIKHKKESAANSNDDDDDSSTTTGQCSGLTAVMNHEMSQCTATPWRSSDGSDHGSAHWRGSAGTPLGRYDAPGNYTQAYDERGRPNARTISNALCAQAEPLPHPFMSAMVWAFGQFVDHTISLSPGQCGADAGKISVDITGDPHFDPESKGAAIETGTTDYAEHPAGFRHPISIITHFVDGNVLYGSTPGRTAQVREFTGGRLRVQEIDDHGDFPPVNDAGMENVGGRRNKEMFLLGDLRANEQVPLLAWHIVWLREHNHQADKLAAKHPDWSDECLFHEAKKYVVAELQKAIFDEFVPVLIGESLPPAAYDSSIDPRIYVEFSKAAYRLHTMVTNQLHRYNPLDGERVEPSLALRDGFTNPNFLREYGIEQVLLGLAKSHGEQIDLKVVDGLRQFLFFRDGEPLDLAALNIIRGREVGVPHFSALREKLGFNPLTSWASFNAPADVKDTLRELYGVDGWKNLDAWVGLQAESKQQGETLPPTLKALLRDQFKRSRDGDSYYYEFDSEHFTADEVAEIKATTLRDILLRNTKIEPRYLQANVFLVAQQT